MTIGIIGTGNVGHALGKALATVGETVLFGANDPDRARAAVHDVPGATVAGVAEAIDASAIVLLAVPYEAALAIASAHADWAGRILVDCTNPLAPGLDGLTIGTSTSAAEQIAARAPTAHVVKAFNTTGFANMLDPHYAGGDVMMPVAGDHAEARAAVIALASRIGFDAFDFGPLAGARYLEPFAMTWIHMAMKLGLGRDFGFVRLKRG